MNNIPAAGFTTAITDATTMQAAFESERSVIAELPGGSAEISVAVVGTVLSIPDGSACFLATGLTLNQIVSSGKAIRDGAVIYLRSASLTITNAANGAGQIYTEDGNPIVLNDVRQLVMLKYELTTTSWRAFILSQQAALNALTASLKAANAQIVSLTTRVNNSTPWWNVLVNGAFEFFDGNPLVPVLGKVGAKGWYAIGEDLGSLQSVQNSDGSLGLKNNNAAAKKTAIVQLIESRDTIALRGQPVTLRFSASVDTPRSLCAAILEWKGTGDNVEFASGNSPVADWSNAQMTAGNFFSGTALGVDACNTELAATSAFQDFYLQATVTQKASNLLAVIWDASPIGGSWNVQDASLYPGVEQRAFYPGMYVVEKERAERIWNMFSKPAAPATPPAAS